MLTQDTNRKILFYLIFSTFVVWLIVEPNINLTYNVGILIVLFVFLFQSIIDKRYLLEKLSDKLTKQKVLLNNLFMNCSDLIYMKDDELNYIDCNPVMKELFDIDISKDILGMNDFELLPLSSANCIRSFDEQALSSGRIVSFKYEKTLQSGDIKIYDALVTPITNNSKITGVLGIMRDTTQNELLKDKIILQNAQLNCILDNIPFMVYLKDLNGKIVVANKGVADFVKRPLDSIVGVAPSESYSRDFVEKIKQEDAEVINTKATLINEFVSNRFTDEKKWFQTIKSPILNDEQEVIGILVTIKNIDHEKKLQAQKETFVASLTHDLKTPTIAQMNAMKLLMNGSLGDLNNEQKEMVQLALDSNIYMVDMLSTILETYKSESGECELEFEEFDFIRLVSKITDELSNLANAKNQSIALNFELNNPMVSADMLQLKRAIVNLISNAITYGYECTQIEIFIYENDRYICFDVKNKSRYIPQECLKEIFEKYKSKDSGKFNKISTGLGLYLSKKIINDHNGGIHASSLEDGTCTFGFTIPRQPVSLNKKTIV